MNLVIYTEAQDKTASAVVSMTDTTPLTELEQLVLGDTPTISVTFTDGSAAPAWAGQAGYTMSLALGTPDGDGRLDYTQIQAETAITGGWEGNLPLDTPALVTALNLLVNQGATILRPPTQRYTYQAPRFAWFVLQIAVRGPDGYLTTYASLRVCVLNRVITSNFTEQQSPDAEVFAWLTDQLDAKANIASPTFTGIPAAPTAAADTDTTQIATTAFVLGQASDATPLTDGTAAAGTSEKYARGNHVHPTDTSRAPLASPTFTGTPAAPTAAVDTSTTQLATTAYVTGQGYLKSATAATTYQPLDAELTAISGLAANGIVTRTSSSTAAARTITGTAGQVTVTNGDGVSGNPTLSLPTALTSINSITAAAATDLTLAGGTAGTNAVKVTNTTAATNTTSGALQVAGGVGVAGSGWFGNGLVTSTTYAGSATNAGINLRNGAIASPNNVLPSVLWDTASLNWQRIDGFRAAGGGFGSTMRFWTMDTGGTEQTRLTINEAGTATFAGVVSTTNTTAATNTTSGALQVAGGVGVQGAGYFGGNVFVGTAASFPTLTFGANSSQIITTSASGSAYWDIASAAGAWNFRSTFNGSNVLTVLGSGNLTAVGNGAFGPSFTPNAWGTGGQLDVNGTTGGILGLAYAGAAKGYVLAESGGILVNSHAGGTAKFNTSGSGATTIGNSGGITLAGVAITTASASATAGLRVPHGAAPTSPVNGDIWTTTAGLFVRINGVTVGPLT